MPIPVIEPQAFYGLKTGIIGNAIYITDTKILYPVGGVLALHDYGEQNQEYIPLPGKRNFINMICTSPDKKLAAISETGEEPCISLYDLIERKRIKGLVIPKVIPLDNITAKEFVSLSFTFEGKYIIAITGPPDWMLLCYDWESGKVESSVRANNPNHPGPVTQVVCNPCDNAVVCTIGPGLFRLFNQSESVWRQFGWQKAEIFPMTCATWLSFDRVLAGTKDGRIILVESGELKAIFRVLDIVEIDTKIKEDAPPVTGDTALLKVNEEALAQGLEVKELITIKRGFLCACGSGTVHLFESLPRSDYKYRKRNVFKIIATEFRDEPQDDLDVVHNLSVNLSENMLLATCRRSQIYSVKLWGPDIEKEPETVFSEVGEPLHHGPVSDLAMCPWKPVFVTLGALDRTIRVWNYETAAQDAVKQYQEDLFCVALHPTGLFVLIGFSEQLRLMILLIDDIQLCRSFNIRKCRIASFSTNGHLFAAVNGCDIEVYSTISYQRMHNLKGHNGEIRALKWTPTDGSLVSCGADGSVYEWAAVTGQRAGEVVTKETRYSDVALMADGKAYGVGSDGQIKEINGSMVIRGIDLVGKPLDAIVLSRSDQMMFVAGASGRVLSVSFPIIEKAVFQEYHMHDQTINKMMLSYDDKTLVTVSEDGTVCLWRLTFTDDKEVQMDAEFRHATEILISKQDLREKVRAIVDLTARIAQLESEAVYERRRTEREHSQTMAALNADYRRALDTLQQENQELAMAQRHAINQVESEAHEALQRHEQALHETEAAYSAKLIVEYDKHRTLMDRLQTMQPGYERQLEDEVKSKEEALAEMKSDYEAQLAEKNTLIVELQECARLEGLQHEATRSQIEEDADREILDYQARYEQRIQRERDNNLKLRGDNGLLRKKFASIQQEIADYKRQVSTANVERQKSQLVIVALDRDVLDLKKDINERDVTIADKEKIIHDTKKKVQELDKYKFVLNYKITELENKIRPKDDEIRELKLQIRGMESESNSSLKATSTLQLQLKDSQEKLSATELLLASERQKIHNNEVLMQRLRTDLENAVQSIQEPNKLKETVLGMHRRYSRQAPARAADFGGGEDFDRQRDHLERTVERLRLQVRKQTETRSTARDRTIKENIVLLEEINQLRRELKSVKEKLGCFEVLIGEYLKKQGRPSSRKEIKDYMAIALTTQEAIHERYEEKLASSEKKVVLLNDEIKRLSAKLTRLGRKTQADDAAATCQIRTVKLELPITQSGD